MIELEHSEVAIHIEVWNLGLLVKSKNIKDISDDVHDSRDKEDVPEDSQALGFGLYCVLLLSQDRLGDLDWGLADTYRGDLRGNLSWRVVNWVSNRSCN